MRAIVERRGHKFAAGGRNVQAMGGDSLHQQNLRPGRSICGFTLIELLITISIIATLAALFLGASQSAMEAARAARTKTTIAKLNTLLMEQYASYQTRRVDIRQDVLSSVGANPSNEVMGDLRLLALRELMKYEMPDRWADVREQPAQLLSGARPPAIVHTYLRRYDRAHEAALAKTNSAAEADQLVADNESAECLYLVVMYLTGDGEARTLFQDRDIGDTDGDGAPEFLDGWGNPIHWLRWPAGFVLRSPLMSGDPQADHDPFDPFRRNSVTAVPAASSFPRSPVNIQEYVKHLRGGYSQGNPVGFRLIPLIYSSGPDGISDIDSSAPDTTSDPSGVIALDPYAVESDGTYQFGLPEDNPLDPDGEDNSIDNIHNQL